MTEVTKTYRNGATARITVTEGPSSQYLIAEWTQGAWQSGAQRFAPEIVTHVEPVVVLSAIDAYEVARAIVKQDDAMGRGVLYVEADENNDLHVWQHDPDDGDEDEDDLCLADVETTNGLHMHIRPLLDMRQHAALLARSILGGAA